MLVNNAAVTFLRPLDGFPERRALLMVEMHLLGPLHLIQLALPGMRERGRGWVLNLTSVAGDPIDGPPFSEFDRTAGFGLYGTVKAALNRLTQSLAAELYDDGIAVNAAAPTNPVATEGASALDLAKEDTEDISLITETVFRLCQGEPKTLTGRVVKTQSYRARSGGCHEGRPWLSRRSPGRARHPQDAAAYCHHLDGGDFSSLARRFTEDGSYTYGTATCPAGPRWSRGSPR